MIAILGWILMVLICFGCGVYMGTKVVGTGAPCIATGVVAACVGIFVPGSAIAIVIAALAILFIMHG